MHFNCTAHNGVLIDNKVFVLYCHKYRGGSRGGGGGGAPGAPTPKIGKIMIFFSKIFHTKYPKNFRAYLRSAQFF